MYDSEEKKKLITYKKTKGLSYWEWAAQKYALKGHLLKAVGILGAPDSINIYQDLLHKKSVLPRLRKYRGNLLLDAGCGVGRISYACERLGIRVIGVDFSSNMIKVAKRICKSSDFIRASLTHLPFKDDTFDVSLTITVLQHITDDSDFVKAIKELQRVTKKLIMMIEEVDGPLNMPKYEINIRPHVRMRSLTEYLKRLEYYKISEVRSLNFLPYTLILLKLSKFFRGFLIRILPYFLFIANQILSKILFQDRPGHKLIVATRNFNEGTN